jgi:predicted dehydrogenase
MTPPDTAAWTALDYRPPTPASPLGIGMVGCGGIARVAARAYRDAGYRVVAVCDLDASAAARMRDEFFPDAHALTDHRELLALADVDVVDIATHTAVRPPLVRDALESGRHVQSQKPFVADLAFGEELCDLADERGVLLAVNQNGRWAPHFAYLLAAQRAGLLGEVVSADFAVHWDHDTPVAGTPFAEMDDLVLLDFGIHWFDLVAALLPGRRVRAAYAQAALSPAQAIRVPTLASALLDVDGVACSLLFRASARFGEEGAYRVDGTRASIRSRGPALGGPDVVVSTAEGDIPVTLEGAWMPHALAGTMGELLAAVAVGGVPTTSARAVLEGLRACFAAIASARTGLPVDPAEVTGR